MDAIERLKQISKDAREGHLSVELAVAEAFIVGMERAVEIRIEIEREWRVKRG